MLRFGDFKHYKHYYDVCHRCKTFRKMSEEESKEYESLFRSGALISYGCDTGAHRTGPPYNEEEFNKDEFINKGFIDLNAKKVPSGSTTFYIICDRCKTYQKATETINPNEMPLPSDTLYGLYRCEKMDHIAFRQEEDQFDLEEIINDGYREWNEEDYYTPPRRLQDNEMYCCECKKIHTMTKELMDGLSVGKKMYADCECGHRIRPWHEEYKVKREGPK